MTRMDSAGLPSGPRFDVLGGSHAVITDARTSTSLEMSRRVRRYTITMAFRTACFLSMLLVDGSLRWVLFGFAVFLPYIAVVFANQANKRTQPTRKPGDMELISAPMLTDGSQADDDVIPGVLTDDEEHHPRDRVA